MASVCIYITVCRELSVLPQQDLAALFLRNLVAVCGGTLPDYEESCNVFCSQIYKILLHMCLAYTYLVSDLRRNFHAVNFTVASNSSSGFAKIY